MVISINTAAIFASCDFCEKCKQWDRMHLLVLPGKGRSDVKYFGVCRSCKNKQAHAQVRDAADRLRRRWFSQ